MIPEILFVSAFLSVALSVFAIGSMLWRLLAGPLASTPIPGLESAPLARVIAALAHWNQAREGLQGSIQRLDRRLDLAGRPLGAGGGAQMLALLELAALGLVGLFTLLLMVAGNGLVTALIAASMVGIATVVLGLAWLEGLVHDRERAISRQYPYFLDLVVMTMEAGSGFHESVEVYVRDAPRDALREELQTVLSDLALGLSEEQTLTKLRERVASEDVRDSIHIITQGLRIGTPLARLLRDQASGLRFRRTQLAERIAEELKIRLMGPATMMMASVIVLILGPVIVNVTQSGMF